MRSIYCYTFWHERARACLRAGEINKGVDVPAMAVLHTHRCVIVCVSQKNKSCVLLLKDEVRACLGRDVKRAWPEGACVTVWKASVRAPKGPECLRVVYVSVRSEKCVYC